MAVERPTFHESWFRVAQLRPRLLSSVQVYRQHFRGQMWYVLENPSSNEFSRVSSDAYHFIGLLDGRKTVAEVWRICNERYGDYAPTQPEVIQLLGNLYCSNLLYAELAPDAESLFNRYHTRIKRRIQGFFSNLLFIHIPLIDPDHFLSRWVGLFGLIFSWFGLLLWLVVISAGLYFIVGNIKELFFQSTDILNPDNFIFLYLSMVIIKIFHEFGHAFACKRFGRLNGSGGEVHVIGIMFLVFVPLPYVDASSAWAFRKKWHRVVVGLSGVMIELFCAAVAAIIWVNTSTGTLHIISYNIIFLASVSTLIFNGNPLLRFDAYYVLSDLIEIPNLSQRSKNYIYYLVKKYCWKLKSAYNPAHSSGEKIWFLFYGIASTAYRVFICIRILLFLNDRLPEELFVLVPIFAGSAVIAWIVVPIGKFIRYLATSGELARSRGVAVSSTLAAMALIVISVGILKVPEYFRIEGIVEPLNMAVVYAESDGFVSDFLLSNQTVSPDGESLITASNPELEAEKKGLLAELRGFQAKRRIAQTRDMAEVQMLDEQIEALNEKIARIDYELAALDIKASLEGTWISPDIDKARGLYLSRGQMIGLVADLDNVFVRAAAGQELAAMLINHTGNFAETNVEIRVKGRPDVTLSGQIEQILPAGKEQLPYQAMGYAVGGSIPTLIDDPKGLHAAERFFEVRIKPHFDKPDQLRSGQRVVARIQMPDRPLLFQWWSDIRQLFQRRFHI
ncbi:MAG: efflux RND transporter periplasmic adaptor subunit [Sedimentisphaerales bacterium]|nr:efflux RND transporter periplasmic adaptor subunit [Sedimentisphaerales bacterium]